MRKEVALSRLFWGTCGFVLGVILALSLFLLGRERRSTDMWVASGEKEPIMTIRDSAEVMGKWTGVVDTVLMSPHVIP